MDNGSLSFFNLILMIFLHWIFESDYVEYLNYDRFFVHNYPERVDLS